MNDNREILFRGFHPCEDGDTTIYVEDEVFKGQWVEGYYCHEPFTERHIMLVPNEDGVLFDFDFVGSYEVMPSTIGQYTCLNDKNGRKIFEGDICIYPSCGGSIDYEFYKGVVKFGEYEQDGSGGEYSSKTVVGFYLERHSAHCGKFAYEGMVLYIQDCTKTDTVMQDYIEVTGTIFDKPKE